MLEEKRDLLKKKGQKKQKKETKKKGVKIFSFFFSFFWRTEEEGNVRLKKEGKERERFDFDELR